MKKNILYVLGMSVIFIFTSCGVGEYIDPSPDMKIFEKAKYPSESKSAVFLQGFDFSSNKNSRKSDKDWYVVMMENSDYIKDVFAYVWYPPVSDSTSDNGYLPRQLNVLDSYYGTKNTLLESASELKSEYTQLIADVVINHRCGTTSWGDFTNPSFDTVKGSNYKAICNDDEGFKSDPNMKNVSLSMRGSADTGDGYSSGRDLDHTNKSVQTGIVTWMNDVLKAAGFSAWRYDYVRGFSPKYVGYYNAMTNADFSIGELWVTNISSDILKWCDGTEESVNGVSGKRSMAFDFGLKNSLQVVFGKTLNSPNKNYGQLASKNCLYVLSPADAVTFVDNHDTGSTQKHWPLDEADIAAAYALILTHPGIPCVAWQHFFTAEESDDTRVGTNKTQYIGGKKVPGLEMNYKNYLASLIALRKSAGIAYDSPVTVLSAVSSQYAAKIVGSKKTLICVLGQSYTPESTWTEVYSGRDFYIYQDK